MDPILNAIKADVNEQLSYYKNRLKEAYFSWQKAKAAEASSKFKTDNMRRLFEDFVLKIGTDYALKTQGTLAAGYYNYFNWYRDSLSRLVYRQMRTSDGKWVYDERIKNGQIKIVVDDFLDVTSPAYTDNSHFHSNFITINDKLIEAGLGTLGEFLEPYGTQLYEVVKNKSDAEAQYGAASNLQSIMQQDVTKIRQDIDDLQARYADYINQYPGELIFKSSTELLEEIKSEPETTTLTETVIEVENMVESLSPMVESPVLSKPNNTGKTLAVLGALAAGAMIMLGDNK